MTIFHGVMLGVSVILVECRGSKFLFGGKDSLKYQWNGKVTFVLVVLHFALLIWWVDAFDLSTNFSTQFIWRCIATWGSTVLPSPFQRGHRIQLWHFLSELLQLQIFFKTLNLAIPLLILWLRGWRLQQVSPLGYFYADHLMAPVKATSDGAIG